VVIIIDIFLNFDLSLNPSPEERDFAERELTADSLNLRCCVPFLLGRKG